MKVAAALAVRSWARRLVMAVFLLISGAAIAGPPYQTDDPEPTDLKHWEIYNFIDVDGIGRETDGEAGFDVNYGAARDLQLTATLPLAFSRQPGEGWRGGRGDVELGAKYRFIEDANEGWHAAVFPRVILPTASRDLGGSEVRLLLPVWLQKDFAKTSIFGGGGYEINPRSGNRNFWQAGIAVTHDLDDKLQLGTEINWQSPAAVGQRSATGVDVGLVRKLRDPFSLLFAAGPTRTGSRTGYHGYAALELNY